MEKKKVAVPLVCHGHSRPVVDLFYSPATPDGFFLISASKDANPMLRNGETGDWIGTFEGHKGAVWSCCLDRNALRAATGSADFSAKIWDALTGDELHSFEHKHIVRACAFSEDTHLLLTGELRKFCTILSSCTDIGGVRLWDVRSGKIIQTLDTKSPVTSAEVSQDGRYITTADGSTVKFWDANHFGLMKSYNMPCNVESASLEPKYGNRFIAGGEDMWVHVFDFVTGEEITCNKGHHGPVHCVRFSPRGESYASGSEDGTIRIWQMGPSTADESEALSANGSTNTGKLKIGVNEVSRKIEGFHIANDGQKREAILRSTVVVALAEPVTTIFGRFLSTLCWLTTLKSQCNVMLHKRFHHEVKPTLSCSLFVTK
uniref:Serine-threonine kinase receptor-associated protein n=1 Tax=Ananas comosus var. bracteatus TaxID=296719 RepID=A0A6V7QR12_ANACO